MKYFSLFLFFVLSISILYSQNVDRKYIEVHNYFKNYKNGINESFNVSPIIRYIRINNFIKKLDSNLNAAEIKQKENYFEPFINKNIDTIFSNNQTYNTYLLFSKPVENILMVEVRKGNYNLKSIKMPYFGTAKAYLFIFDDQNKITKVLSETVSYN